MLLSQIHSCTLGMHMQMDVPTGDVHGVQGWEQSALPKCEAEPLNCFPLNGVLQGSDGGHSRVPETWEGMGLFCKKPRVSDAFSGEGPWKRVAEQDSAFQTKTGPLPLPKCQCPPLRTPGLGGVIANHV